mgnify:CR=1 FL=1
MHMIARLIKKFRLSNLPEHDSLQAFVHTSPCAAALLDRNLSCITVNEQWCTQFNLHPGHAVGQNHMALYPHLADDSKQFEKLYHQVFEGKGQETEIDLPGAHENTSFERARLSFLPWTGDNHNALISHIIVFARPVPIAEHLEPAQKIQNILDITADAMITINQHGIIQSYSDNSQNLFGYQPDDVVGENIRILMPESVGKKHDTYLKNYLETGQANIIGKGRELTARHKDGYDIPIYLLISEFEVNGQKYFTGIIRNLSKHNHILNTQDKAGQALLQTQKMEALGQLSGGIAHDFNNLLTIICCNTALAKEYARDKTNEAPECQELDQFLNIIEQSANRGAELVKKLMMMTRETNLDATVVDLNDIIRNLQHLLKSSLNSAIEMNISAQENLWPVVIDHNQLEHALINLCTNARDAMPNGGSLTIRTYNTNTDSMTLPADLKTQPDDKDFVVLEVSDTGTGMDEATINRIFEPFFTTKEPGKGTGLGLSHVYSFIKQSGGTIEVISRKRQGTTFRIFLPRCRKEITLMRNQQDKTPRETQGSETIMVVEDEAEIRQLTETILSRAGYTVISAANGNDAIDIIAQDACSLDLLFTDIVMPGDFNGIEIAARALELNTNLHVVFTTGHTEENIPAYNLIQDYHIFSKPYYPGDMLHTIRAILDQNPSSAVKHVRQGS